MQGIKNIVFIGIDGPCSVFADQKLSYFQVIFFAELFFQQVMPVIFQNLQRSSPFYNIGLEKEDQ
jgi:hypothetical protein